jgi:Zn-dependent protease with chaperone function
MRARRRAGKTFALKFPAEIFDRSGRACDTLPHGRAVFVKTGVRAALAVMLLIGFYALGAGLLAAVLGLDVLMLYGHAPEFDLFFGIPFTAVAFIMVARAFHASIRLPAREIKGIAVLEVQQPALWSRVRAAADAAGTAPPEHLWIDSNFNASVFEQTRWLGLRSGARHLVVGAPMLIAFSPAELDVVFAHEFGHFAHRDTRLLPVIMRGRAGLAGALNTATFFTTGSVSNGRWLLTLQQMILRIVYAYAIRFLTVTQNISRIQEYAADRISAELCGRDTAAGTIAEIPAYSAAYRYFRARFADAALGLGLVPRAEDLFPGFRHMLEDPLWQGLAEAERTVPAGKTPPTRFDSHPPIADRVAALRALPDDGRSRETSGSRAIDLLDDPQTLLAAAAGREERRLDKRATDWDTLIDAVGRAQARKASARLVDTMHLVKRGTPTLADFFDHIEAGRMESLLYSLLTPTQARYAPSGPVAREVGSKVLATALPAWITAELADAGLVHWKHSWSAVAIRDAQDATGGVGEALTALLGAEPSEAAPAAAALREILRDAGVAV